MTDCAITVAHRTRPAGYLLWPAAAASLLLVAAGTGLVPPLVPILGVAFLTFVCAAPTRWTALGLLGIALLVDNPGERPMENRWQSPLLPPGELLYLNLHKHTGIEALRFSALELLIALLMLVVVARKLTRDPLDDPLRLGALPNPMKNAFAVFFGAIVFLEVYGLARHGDFKNSLWQVRQLFWLPVLGVLFGQALKSEGARRWLLRIVMLVAFLRALEGLYYYFALCKPAGFRPEYTTTHSDSILAVLAMLIGAMALVGRPCRNHVLLNLMLQPVLLAGLIVNDRRIAYVALAGGLAILVALAPPALRRAVRRGILLAIPFLLVYTAVGWHSRASIFRPVSTVRELFSQDDASSQTRDIENFNLIRTLKLRPVLGSGFGHEYVEFVQANRVDQIFAQYRFIAHNSVLWVLSLSGWVGFTLIWLAFPVSVLLAMQVFQRARNVTDQTTAFGALAAVLCFSVQAWGDMGLQSWMGTLLVAAFTGATGAMWISQRYAEGRTCI